MMRNNKVKITDYLTHVYNLFNTSVQFIWLYSVVVITFGFDPDNPGSNPGTTYFLVFYRVYTELERAYFMMVE